MLKCLSNSLASLPFEIKGSAAGDYLSDEEFLFEMLDIASIRKLSDIIL